MESQTSAAQLMPDHKMREFAATNEADFGYTLPGVGRFRVNAFRQRGNGALDTRGVGRFRVNAFRQRGTVGLAIRRVRAEVPTFEELLLPPVMKDLSDSSRG